MMESTKHIVIKYSFKQNGIFIEPVFEKKREMK